MRTASANARRVDARSRSVTRRWTLINLRELIADWSAWIARDLGDLNRVILDTDSPAGSGVQRLGILAWCRCSTKRSGTWRADVTCQNETPNHLPVNEPSLSIQGIGGKCGR